MSKKHKQMHKYGELYCFYQREVGGKQNGLRRLEMERKKRKKKQGHVQDGPLTGI